MRYVELHLFRVKFIRPAQTLLLSDNRTSSELFHDALLEKPSAELRSGFLWHIGNVVQLDDSGGAFAIGRTTNTTLSRYDEEQGNFVEEDSEDSPYTVCLYDLQIGFVAIKKKTRLSPTTEGIARQLSKLLSQTEAAKSNEIEVRIDAIPDPFNFIARIQSARYIKRFTAHFTGPNPFDADELFQKPLSVYCQAIQGETGKVITEGEALDSETAISVTRSVAATGNEASARIIEHEGSRARNIHLKGDNAKCTFPEDEFVPSDGLNAARSEYQRVRSA